MLTSYERPRHTNARCGGAHQRGAATLILEATRLHGGTNSPAFVRRGRGLEWYSDHLLDKLERGGPAAATKVDEPTAVELLSAVLASA
eukprot:4453518-Pleurochrysis_carterae.AAC.1